MKKSLSVLIVLLCVLQVFLFEPVPSEAKSVDNREAGILYQSVSTGSTHTCAITSNGGVRCWGVNDNGELGNGTTFSSYTPVDVVGLTTGVSAVTVGGNHTCALTEAGGVKCWGANGSGQLGDESNFSRDIPVDVVGLTSGVLAVSAGTSHTCAMLNDGSIKCWGGNESGQLGDGTFEARNTPVDVINLASGNLALSAGFQNACVITGAGGMQCWGNGSIGQLGNGIYANSNEPVAVQGMDSGVLSISGGCTHTCAVKMDGSTFCWGLNDNGQLGDGTQNNSAVPVTVLGLGSDVESIHVGDFYHTCALMEDGSIKCWGDNYFGELGNGNDSDSLLPVDVTGLAEGAVFLDLGENQTCAVTTQGKVKCWGDNRHGQLGQGGTPFSAIPIFSEIDTTRYTQIDLGQYHGCGLTMDGGVQCWGSNNFGQVGDAFEGDKYSTGPLVNVTGLDSGMLGVAAGGEHSCAITATGGVNCWGLNEFGQLGDGNSGYNWSSTPVDVSGLDARIIKLVVGDRHSCALDENGGVVCWGSNEYGQTGNGSLESLEVLPVDVSGLSSGVLDITAGSYHTCALMTGGGIKCWGQNDSYQLGDGTTNPANVPVDVTGLGTSVMTMVSGGVDHTCALSGEGIVKCWGHISGTLYQTPQQITGLETDTTFINAGGIANGCAIDGSQGLKCWGFNQYGEVGNGTFVTPEAPEDVIGLSGNVETVTCNSGFCCALVGEGRMKCWGSNDRYRLGVGGVTYSTVPLELVEVYLQVNYSEISTGGFVTVTGSGLASNVLIALYANGTFLGEVTTTDSGDFIVYLDTQSAGSGYYEIRGYYVVEETSQESRSPLSEDQLSTQFSISSFAGVTLKEGDGLTFELPEGVGILFHYLPLLLK